MNAQSFLGDFLKKTNEETIVDGKSLIEIYKNGADYTPVVTKIINSIIEENGLTYQNEYFRIDAIGWETNYKEIEDKAKELGLNAHLWDLKVAVEHENSLVDWTDEVIKLIHIKCPLKVIIGYNNYNKRADNDDEKKLEAVSGWMKRVEAFKTGENEEYLIIIGNAMHSETKKQDYESFDYRGYLYDWKSGRFKPVQSEGKA